MLVKTDIKSGFGHGLGSYLKLKDENLPRMAIIDDKGK